MAATTKGLNWPYKKIGPGGLLTLAGVVFSTVTLAADAFVGWNAYRQVRALDYDTTPGVITRSEVQRHEGSSDKSTTYSASIKYNYVAAGKAYSGDRYRYGWDPAGDEHAGPIVSEHPAGKVVTVYYSPENPADALLSPGLEGFDLFVWMFWLPFNLAPLGMLALLRGRLWSRCFGYRGAGAKVWDDGFVARVRLLPTPPSFFAALAPGVLAFAVLFPILFSLGGPDAPKWLMVRVWAAILCSAPLAYLIAVWRQRRGKHDLVIDMAAGTISLLRTSFPKLRIAKRIDGITSIEVRSAGIPGSPGEISPATVRRWFSRMPTASAGRRRSSNGQTRAAPEALAAWLRQRLRIGLPASR